jgi:predicted Zn-dependent peptidase
VGTQADKLEDAINGMNELIADMPEVPIVLDQSKQNMKKTYESERISQDGPIYAYLDARRKGLDYDLRKAIYGKLDQLTMADVKAFHQSNIAGKPYTYCLVASKDKVNLEMLKKYGEVKELSLTELFGY